MKKAAFSVLVFLLIFCPLAFGTVEQWSYTVMEGGCLLMLPLVFLDALKKKRGYIYRVPGTIPLLLIWFYMLIQTVPMPLWIIKVLSPSTAQLYSSTSGLLTGSDWFSLSINKKATLIELFRFTAYAVFYIAAVEIFTHKERLKRIVSVLTLFFPLLAVFAILQYILFNGKIYWIRELTEGGTPFGPYVNRNHYASIVAMVFPLLVSLFLYYKPSVTYSTLKERIVELFSQNRTNLHILIGFSCIIIATSVFLSLSRGGIISLSLSMVFFGILFAVTERRRTGWLIMVISAFIVIAVGWFGWEPIIERFERLKSPSGGIADLRPDIWRDSLEIARDFPVTGTGYGTFVNIYPAYKSLKTMKIVDHAHNDYIEAVAEGGVVGTALFLFFILSVIVHSYGRFRQRKDKYCKYLYIGALSGMLAITIHSFTDFNLHIGANGLYLFLLLALLVSFANTRNNGSEKRSLLKTDAAPMRLLTVITAVMLILNLFFNLSVLYAGLVSPELKDTDLRLLTSEKLRLIESRAVLASGFDPLESRHHYMAGMAELILGIRERAFQNITTSLLLEPTNGQYLQRVGLLLSEKGNENTAEEFLKAGIRFDRMNPDRYTTYALWLIHSGRKDEALKYIGKAIELEPENTARYITLMILYRFTDTQIMESLPHMVRPYLQFAQYLADTGKDSLAEKAYERAMLYASSVRELRPWHFFKIYRFYVLKNRYEEALKVMKEAVKHFPEEIRIRLTLASLYERTGITFRATEEYKRVLMMDPGNRKALEGLRRLGALE